MAYFVPEYCKKYYQHKYYKEEIDYKSNYLILNTNISIPESESLKTKITKIINKIKNLVNIDNKTNNKINIDKILHDNDNRIKFINEQYNSDKYRNELSNLIIYKIGNDLGMILISYLYHMKYTNPIIKHSVIPITVSQVFDSYQDRIRQMNVLIELDNMTVMKSKKDNDIIKI